ncbi:MAG: P1 family peptidase [Clostridia bacterium]|nr:P1 family peptidase [Clostridia bacterium]
MGLPKEAGFDLHSKFKAGEKNLISDVEGVSVGHKNVRGSQDIHTGVTALFPAQDNLFKNKVMAASSVINGFGKSIGLLQIDELGTIETPILLTNTLSIGTAFTALTKYMLEQNDDIGVKTGTVNCVVTECNDGTLNDIRGLHVTERDCFDALNSASVDFKEGAVGGGSGMACLGLKGGIGSASRVLNIDDKEYTIGALVMSNFGEAGNLVIGGKHYDTKLCNDKDKGSIIMIIATDIPLSERQLKRVSKRALVALARTGSFSGNGSGDIAIAFTTANRVAHYPEKAIMDLKMINDDKIDPVFQASVEAVEEAIVSSLYHAETTLGIRDNKKWGLQDFLKEFY